MKLDRVMRYISGCIILLFISTSIVSAQEILLNSIREAKNDISAREYPVIDSNGDASAIIKARLGIKDVEFMTDLYINRIEERDGEIWLWVPPGTSSLKLIVMNNDTVSVQLPIALKEYDVCILLFTVKLSAQVIYTDMPTLTIETSPNKAEVYINNIFQGFSPIKLSLYPDTLSFRIVKDRYRSFSDKISISDEDKEISISLRKADSVNRWFFSVCTDAILHYHKNIGFMLGTMGKTGWYVSLIFPYNKTSNDLELTAPNQNLNFDTYYLDPVSPVKLIMEFNLLVIGVTQNIFRNKCFGSLGLSYGRTSCSQYFNQVPYSTSSKIPIHEIVASYKNKNIKAPGIDLGASFRLFNHLIVSMNCTSLILRTDNVGYETYHDEYFRWRYQISDLKFALGYNF